MANVLNTYRQEREDGAGAMSAEALLIPHFHASELLSPDGLELLARGLCPLSPELLLALQKLREAVDRPVLVNHAGLKFRGYRSQRENEKVKGSAKNSYHCRGEAVDVTIPGMTPEQVAEVARQCGFRGIGIYKTFTHCDVRQKAVTWRVAR